MVINWVTVYPPWPEIEPELNHSTTGEIFLTSFIKEVTLLYKTFFAYVQVQNVYTDEKLPLYETNTIICICKERVKKIEETTFRKAINFFKLVGQWFMMFSTPSSLALLLVWVLSSLKQVCQDSSICKYTVFSKESLDLLIVTRTFKLEVLSTCNKYSISVNTDKNGPRTSLHNCFSHRGAKITNFDQIADIFNEYFVSVGPSLAKSINVIKKDLTDYLKGNHTASMFLRDTAWRYIMW